MEMPLKQSRRSFLKVMASTAALLSLERDARSVTTRAAGDPFPVREVYCPAHFGNSYEAMWPRETADYLAELKWWGFNRYADWITATDVRNPYASDAYWDLAREQLDRKKQAFLAAQRLGLALNLIVTPNHVYLDQLRPELEAVKGPRISGQLLCPSKPAARRIILDNFANWCKELADGGVRLSTITAFAYDYGGCGCEQCKPWILTWARLMRDAHAVARKFQPDVEIWMCSWWWTAEEHRLLNDWAAREAPNWIKAMTLHIEYGHTRFKDVAVPPGCRRIAFVHNGYADTRDGGDIYAKYGPVIAPDRLPRTLDDIRAQDADGFQLYSEGLFDDCNKAIVAGIGSGTFSSASAALATYAQRYFRTSRDEWARWLAQWGDRRTVKLADAATQFESLAAGASASWRLEQWRSMVRLETIDREIGSPTASEWTPAKLQLADAFWAEQERLNRDVYRLGPTRHVFARKFSPTRWYGSWQKATRATPATTATTLPAET
jgi:hypothetical protein